MFNVSGLHGVRENVFRRPVRKEIETMFWLKGLPLVRRRSVLRHRSVRPLHHLLPVQPRPQRGRCRCHDLSPHGEGRKQTGQHGANEASRLNLWQPGRAARLPEFTQDCLKTYSADFTIPITFPSGSEKWARVTIPGISIIGIVVLPPRLSALSSVACRSSTPLHPSFLRRQETIPPEGVPPAEPGLPAPSSPPIRHSGRREPESIPGEGPLTLSKVEGSSGGRPNSANTSP